MEAVWTIIQTTNDDVKKVQLAMNLQGRSLNWHMKFLQVPTGTPTNTLA